MQISLKMLMLAEKSCDYLPISLRFPLNGSVSVFSVSNFIFITLFKEKLSRKDEDAQKCPGQIGFKL